MEVTTVTLAFILIYIAIMWCEIRSPHKGAILFLILIFATITGFWLRITLIYCRNAWRLLLEDQEAHRVWGRRRGIMVRGGAAIMIWGGWECMTTMGVGWNGVAEDSRSFRRKLTKFWEAICGGAEKTGALLGQQVRMWGWECEWWEVCDGQIDSC
jgi:hypothetical protein